MHQSERILSSDLSQAGDTTGGRKKCPMNGCKGERLAVRWHDGKITWPCTEGLIFGNGFIQLRGSVKTKEDDYAN